MPSSRSREDFIVASDAAKAGSETVQAEWSRESARMAQTRRMEKVQGKGTTIQGAEVFALPSSGLAGALAFKRIPLRTGLLPLIPMRPGQADRFAKTLGWPKRQFYPNHISFCFDLSHKPC